MAKIAYAVQRPGEGPTILNAYRALATSVPFDRLTGLFAFASAKGALLLSSVFQQANSRWRSVAKRWVISIDGGITEPGALRFLLQQRNVEVRVPYAEELLGRHLKPIHRFHPKTMLLETLRPRIEPTAICVGSANLTCNGLCFGHEHALVVQLTNGAIPGSLSTGIHELAVVIESATKITEDFVDRYESIRPVFPTLLEEFEDHRSERILQVQAVIEPAESVAWLRVAKENGKPIPKPKYRPAIYQLTR